MKPWLFLCCPDKQMVEKNPAETHFHQTRSDWQQLPQLHHHEAAGLQTETMLEGGVWDNSSRKIKWKTYRWKCKLYISCRKTFSNPLSVLQLDFTIETILYNLIVFPFLLRSVIFLKQDCTWQLNMQNFGSGHKYSRIMEVLCLEVSQTESLSAFKSFGEKLDQCSHLSIGGTG